MTLQRPVFFISDSTGITVETLGHSLLTQFETIDFKIQTLRYIDTVEKAQHAHELVVASGKASDSKPLVFSTVVDDRLRDILAQGEVQFFDFMEEFISPLEKELATPAVSQVGHSHAASIDNDYQHRMDAVTYALKNDDGGDTRHYDQADIIIIGVSRSGKTPTCLYLALHYGLYAANYPFVEQDLDSNRLPRALQPYQDKLFGLGISAERLHQIRSNRRPDSRYAA
ncbi:MAG: pyruvate, phosphate dikinase/phosphoenolpyruvate synthase regulator, partial [Thioalkalispiraceae bacterium]